MIRPSGYLFSRVVARRGRSARRRPSRNRRIACFHLVAAVTTEKTAVKDVGAFRFGWKLLEPRRLLSTYVVDNTGDSAVSIRGTRCGRRFSPPTPIPAPAPTTSPSPSPPRRPPDLNVPVPGFDPGTQDWTITLGQPPADDHPAGFDRWIHPGEHASVPSIRRRSARPFRSLSICGSPTGGSFTLTTSAPLPVGTTVGDSRTTRRRHGPDGPGGDRRRRQRHRHRRTGEHGRRDHRVPGCLWRVWRFRI